MAPILFEGAWKSGGVKKKLIEYIHSIFIHGNDIGN